MKLLLCFVVVAVFSCSLFAEVSVESLSELLGKGVVLTENDGSVTEGLLSDVKARRIVVLDKDSKESVVKIFKIKSVKEKAFSWITEDLKKSVIAKRIEKEADAKKEAETKEKSEEQRSASPVNAVEKESLPQVVQEVKSEPEQTVISEKKVVSEADGEMIPEYLKLNMVLDKRATDREIRSLMLEGEKIKEFGGNMLTGGAIMGGTGVAMILVGVIMSKQSNDDDDDYSSYNENNNSEEDGAAFFMATGSILIALSIPVMVGGFAVRGVGQAKMDAASLLEKEFASTKISLSPLIDPVSETYGLSLSLHH